MADPNLYDFVINTVTKPSRLAKAMHQPQKYYDDAVAAGALSSDDRELLESGDAGAISAEMQRAAGLDPVAAPPGIWILVIGPGPPPSSYSAA